jgi:hypothetical protein
VEPSLRPTNLGALVVEDDGLELVEEEFALDPADVGEGGLQPSHQGAHGLAGIELEPEESREAEDDQEDVTFAPGQADLLEEPDRGELGIGLKPLANQRLIGVELGGHRCPRPVADTRGVTVQGAGGHPALQGATITAEALGERGDRQALLEIVAQSTCGSHPYIGPPPRSGRLYHGRWVGGKRPPKGDFGRSSA